jgi:hypothetical protein
LTARDFFAGEFRSVWVGYTAPEESGLNSEIQVRAFTSNQLDEFLGEVKRIGDDTIDGSIEEMRRSESTDRWIHYVAYLNGVPAATSTMMYTQGLAYLAWSFTEPRFRQKGLQSALIRRRLQDAHEHADYTFAVTSFDIPSARNLQRHGLSLAYNYVMYVRTPRTST